MRWPISCLIFLCYSCNNTSTYNNLVTTKEDSLKEEKKIENAFKIIDSVKKNIATGDLIVRTGNDFTSESLRSLNRRDKTYSHCGIASIENDTLFVYHALGGEWNPNQKLRRDVFELFAEPYSNRGIGIYRYDISPPDISGLVVTVKQLYRMGIMFDMKFDLQTNDHMYCAEFVYKAYVMGCRGKLQFNVSHIGNFAFIGVDDLFMQPLCKEQKKILYQ
jgi:Permuted papain-like amidase enzyme, YaeF/YiiX, C92 family